MSACRPRPARNPTSPLPGRKDAGRAHASRERRSSGQLVSSISGDFTVRNDFRFIRRFGAAAILACTGWAAQAPGAAVEPAWSLVQKEKPAVLETMKSLVNIESGSADREGLDRIAELIAKRLRETGGKVELIEPGAEIYKMFDTPEKIGRMARATFTGTGKRKILLLAHMDTVYPRGMLAQQPYEIKGDRAYGLGIGDDKHGISVILHTLAVLKAMNYRSYGTLTVLINGDEEISSPD